MARGVWWDLEETTTRKVLCAEDIPLLGHTVRKRWLGVPEWGGREVCMWGTTLGDRVRIEADAAMAGDDTNKAALRRQVATVLECARDGDGPEARRVFCREQHWGWLEQQPSSVLDPLYLAVADLDLGSEAQAEAVMSFFEIAEDLRHCLTRIASACGACTDCPANCPPASPPRPSTPPCLPTQ